MGHLRHIRRVRRATGLALGAVASLGLFSAAHAQSDADAVDLSPVPSATSPGLTLNLPVQSSVDLIGAIDVPRLDLPPQAVGSTLFRLDLSDPSCLTGDLCERRDTDTLDFGLSRSIAATRDSGIDLVLRPRASVRFDDEGSRSALVGAVVEIGEDLREGSEFSANTWYLFAGADAEALTYSPDSLSRFNNGTFHLQDRIIVGDAQAGVGYRIGDADVSVSYLRREAQAEGLSFTEDAAALSFTWKR